MPVNLPDAWTRTVRRNSAALAVVDGVSGQSWTRADIEEAACSWAGGVSGSSRMRRRRVLISESNGAGWLSVFLGLLKLGAVPVPVDGNETHDRLRETAENTGAGWIWSGGSLREVNRSRSTRREDVCLVKLTSGSTGTPNALAFSHSQMIADGAQVCSTMGIRSDDLNLGTIPFGHSYGLGNLVLPLLIQGTAIVSGSGAIPSQIAADCLHAKPTVFPAVPALLRLLVDSDVDRQAFASLRLVISAGSALTSEVAHAFREKFETRVHGFYGSTETGGICYDRTGEATLEGRSVGTPLDGVDLLFRRGGRFEVRSAAVVGRGRFTPKDRGKLNERGELVLLGRIGRITKIAGRRLDLGEVESLLRRVRGVADAYVALHPQREESLVAMVATNRRVMELRREMAEISASWKIPAKMIVLKEFPMTARGKVDTRKLRALIGSRCSDQG